MEWEQEREREEVGVTYIGICSVVRDRKEESIHGYPALLIRLYTPPRSMLDASF